MAKYSNTVEYQIRTTLDSSGIAKLKAELNSLQSLVQTRSAQGILNPSAVNKTLADINKVKIALQEAFNPKLGMVSNKALFNSLGKDLNSIYQSFSQLGPQGVRAFAQVYNQIGKIDLGMKQISSTADKIVNTFGNTFRWGVIASIFSGIMNTIHQSVQYVKDLDNSLTQIMMVSGISRENMNQFAVQANEAAKILGGTTVQMTEATKVFIQQGFDLQQSAQLGSYAVHLANVSEQDSATASDEITAYMNAFKIPLNDLGNAISKWAAVANATAVDVEELSVASQKAASVAATVGVDLDQFAGHIAAIESVTREAPENIGNGLKTIYSRIADISLGETLEDGVNLGSFAKAIEKVGVQVLDSAGNLRNAGDILEDLMHVWQDLDQTQRAAVAKTVAGRFQLARFEALMNRADIYENAANISRQETGTDTYDRMQETYKTSMEGRLNTLTATIEGIFVKAFNTDDFYGLIDAATKLAETFDNLIQAMGGGGQAVLALGAIITKVFSDQFGRGISNMITNRATARQGIDNRQGAMDFAKAQLAGAGLNTNNVRVNELANSRAEVAQYAPQMNTEQIERANSLWDKQVATFRQLNSAEEEYQITTQATKTVLNALGFSSEEVNIDLIALLKTIEQGGAQAKITGETLTAIQTDQFVDKLRNAQLSITSFITHLEKAQKTGAGWDKVIDDADKLGISLKEIGQAANLSKEQMQSLENIIAQLDAVTEGEEINAQQLSASLQEANINVGQLAAGLEKLIKAGGANSEILEKQEQATINLASASRQLAAESRGMASNLNIQAIVAQFANLASAGMTAMFALQSVGNIIKILDNEDLTIAEKTEQLAMNLTMVAAMGIPAITQTKTAIAELKNALMAWQQAQALMMVTESTFANQEALNISLRGQRVQAIVKELVAQDQLNREMLEARLIEEGYSASVAKGMATKILKLGIDKAANDVTKQQIITEKLLQTTYGKTIQSIGTYIVAKLTETTVENGATVAKNKGRIATLALAAAEKVAAGNSALLVASIVPLAAAAAIIIGLVAGIRHISKEEEKRKENLQKEIEVNQEAVKAIHEQRDNLVQLHAQYQRTGEASDEYKEALKQQAEALNIVNADLLIASGRYDELKDKIDEATLSTLTYNDALLEQRQKDNQSHVSGRIEELSNDAAIQAGIGVETYIDSSGYVSNVKTGDDISNLYKVKKAYEDNREEIGKLNVELKNLQATNENGKNNDRIEEINAEIDRISALNNEYIELLGSEEAQQAFEDNEQLVQNEILEAGMYGYLGDTDYDSLYKTLTTGPGFEHLQAAIAGMSDEEAEAYVNGLIYGVGERLNDRSLMDEVKLKDTITSKSQEYADKFGVDLATGEKWISDLTKDIEGFDKLDTGTQIKIIARLDVEESEENLKKDVQDVIQRLKNGDTVEGIFSAEDIVTMKPIDTDVDEKTFQHLGKYIGENADKLEDFDKALKHDTNELANVTEEILRFDKALEKSQDKIDDWDKALKSDSMEERAEAASELNDIYTDLLGVGEGIGLSTDFTEDIDNLKLLQRVMQGDMDAYDELQRKAAEDIVTQFAVNDEEALAKLNNLWSEMDRIKFEDIEIGATIDDTDFLTACEEMINAAGMSSEQAEAALAEMGIDAEVVPGTATAEDEMTASDLIVREGPGVNTDITLPAEGSVSSIIAGTIDIPSIITEANPVKTSINKAFSAFSLKTTGAKSKKSSGGGLTIKNAKKGASGASKYKNASYGGGGKGSSKSGGGSKGGGKSYTPKTKDYKAKEKDRYEKVNTALSEIDSSLANITKEQDRLTGVRWLENLEKETDLLKEQVPWYEEKLKIQKEEAAELRKQLTDQFGATFADNGQLANYADIFDKLEAKRAAAYEKYNKATTEKEQEKYEDEIKGIEEEQSAFEKLYARYDTLWSKDILETQKALEEIQNRLEDIAEEARKARRDAAKELDELRKDYEEFEKTMGNLFGDHIQIDLDLNTQRWNDLMDSSELTEAIEQQKQKYLDMLNDPEIKAEQKEWLQRNVDLMDQALANGTSVFDLNRQRLQSVMLMREQYEKTGKYLIEGADGKLIESDNEQYLKDMEEEVLEDAKDWADELADVIAERFDIMDKLVENMQDGLDANLASYEAINEELEYMADMNELIYGDRARQEQIDWLTMQAKNNEGALQALEATREHMHDITQEYAKLLESDKDNLDYQKKYQEALENERDIDSQILDMRKDIVQAYKDAKEAANELAVQNWTDNFMGDINGVAVPLEQAANQWERIQENEELYLDDLNKAYEIQKLQNKYQEMLNDATDPMIQQKITDQMNQQLAYLREKTNLSEYDVKYANAQLEILQKTIALEDARAAKNQMKLRRDSQGNYQYVYAEDKNNTLGAQNDLLDATMEAYNMSKEQQANVQDNVFNKLNDMAQQLRDVANDETLTAEQIEAITQDIIQKGYEYLDAMGEQLNESQKNMIESFIKEANGLQEVNASVVQEIANQLLDGTINSLDMVDDRFDTSVKNWIGDDGLALFRDEVNTTKEDIVDNINAFVEAVSDANTNVSVPLNDMSDNMQHIADATKEVVEETERLYKLLSNDKTAFGLAAEQISEWQNRLADANKEFKEYKDWVEQTYGIKQADAAANSQLGLSGGGTTGNSGLTSQQQQVRKEAEAAGIKVSKLKLNVKHIVKAGDNLSQIAKTYYNDANAWQAIWETNKKNLQNTGSSSAHWIYPGQVVYLKSGGYTGAWGAEGRLAMLHEKELVLNAEDTRNILAAVEAVRIITDQLKGSAFTNNIATAVGRASQNNIQGSNVEQRVEITANFPNVNSAKEIEEALLSLSDTSYQYAYNKNDIPW